MYHSKGALNRAHVTCLRLCRPSLHLTEQHLDDVDVGDGDGDVFSLELCVDPVEGPSIHSTQHSQQPEPLERPVSSHPPENLGRLPHFAKQALRNWPGLRNEPIEPILHDTELTEGILWGHGASCRWIDAL